MFIVSLYRVFMRKLSQNEFLTKAKAVHGDRYSYDKSIYQNARQRVEIICQEHGPFFQLARSHIHQAQGCPSCASTRPLTEHEFDDRVYARHGLKFRREGAFAGLKYPVVMRCQDHGTFTCLAEVHLRGDGSCPTCTKLIRIENLKTGNISASEKQWLDDLCVEKRQHRISLNGIIIVVDGFDEKTQTVYEYYGSYWHGNPEIYEPTDLNSVLNVSFGELYSKTIERENLIRQFYNIVTIWGR